METEKFPLGISWIHGKHSEDVDINTRMPFVHIGEYFWQGDEADVVIAEIFNIYKTEICTPLQAAEKWASNML